MKNNIQNNKKNINLFKITIVKYGIMCYSKCEKEVLWETKDQIKIL